MLSRNVAYIDANSMSELYHDFRSKRPFLTALFSIIMSIVLPDKEICTVAGSYSFGIYFIGRCAQIPAIFENLIPRPEEKKDIFTDTPIFDD